MVVNYADDFVILCRGTAQKARDAAEQIITGMKLRMNQEKTQVVDASRQPFDFLGYTFGPCYRGEIFCRLSGGTGRPKDGSNASTGRFASI